MSAPDVVSAVLRVWNSGKLRTDGIEMRVQTLKEPFPVVDVAMIKGKLHCARRFDPDAECVCVEGMVEAELRNAIEQFAVYEERKRKMEGVIDE